MENRITYLDGAKLILCYWIALFHFVLAYFPQGFIGYGTTYTEAEKLFVVKEDIALALFSNSSLHLYLFFAIIALIPTVTFYKSNDAKGFLKKQSIKRYFRFVIPVAVITLLTYGLDKANLFHFENVYHISGATWNLGVKPIDVSFWEAVYIGFIKCFFVPSTNVVTVLWCMDIIFIGSLLTYGFLAILGKSKKRYVAYIILSIFCIPFPKYFVFLIGIICGDILVHGIVNIRLTEIKKESLAFLFLFLGIAVGVIPVVYIAPPITTEHTYAVGAGFVLIGFMLSETMQKILSGKGLVSQSTYSFSVLLVHIPILFGISDLIFNFIYDFTGQYVLSFWIMFIICAVITHAAAILFYNLFEKSSAQLADFIYNKLQ